MNWLWFIPVLLVMVIIHEFGHFITARMFGMKVHEFGIGFPPKVWSKKTKDGMEWSINALPIGGFVRIEGENGDSDDPNSFGKKPTWQRAIVLCAGPFMNLVLAFAIYFILAGGGKDVPAGPVAISKVEPGSPAAMGGMLPGDIILKVNSTEANNTRDVSIETRLNRSQPIVFTLKRGNQIVSTTIKGRTNPPDGEGIIGVQMGYLFDSLRLAADAPAYDLKSGDVLTMIDGKPLANNQDLLNYTTHLDKSTVEATVQRVTNGKTETLTRTLAVKLYVNYVYTESDASRQKLPVDAQIIALNDQKVSTASEYIKIMTVNQGQDVKISYIDPKSKAEKAIIIIANYTDTSGVNNRSPRPSTIIDGLPISQMRHVPLNPFEWWGEAWGQTTYAIGLIPRSLEGVFNGSIGLESFAGPVGMAQITDQIVDTGGFMAVISLMALLSVNLGIVNILPLPALDGGRLIFVLIEMISRRRVPPDKEGMVHMVGMVALLSLMLVFTWNDIARLITGAGFS
jgi:regulator of sigma E protease